MIPAYPLGLLVAFASAGIAFFALMRETDGLHRLLLTDLVEVVTLAFIALVGTDLAEALILPGLVVGVSELIALSEIFRIKEGYTRPPTDTLQIEVMKTAPPILAALLVGYGIVLSGFSGGAVAGLGVIFYFLSRNPSERFEVIETASGYSWILWIVAFFTFMILPQYWFFAVMLAGSAILVKVMAKMSLIGTMRGGPNA
ncbi:EhaG family protein [Methanoculleus bourgensis]|jgi:energy-converting hydrogenase A subunit G|uniref:EhaG family protein n=2 Tax=Methanoculleus bourgensis TaxID=83986 RepID=A0A0X3BKU0_9EURY|nr:MULTISPECIES: EhaG family protein [Methanoculleus]MBT0733251.1 EhaG family protein [Methanoculleus bourgensis]MDD3372785.1 EhaG family protein [Methanoculleus bourgensis]NMA88675.1 EhaG family protein [Methanoculleus bourgensis]NQS78130.1 EhaG family protein [Methanoculleus bourgensis]CCJ36168.1 membrane-bound hydrogenase subunit ehaG [Methanoculleus bourgensis MS2]